MLNFHGFVQSAKCFNILTIAIWKSGESVPSVYSTGIRKARFTGGCNRRLDIFFVHAGDFVIHVLNFSIKKLF